MLAKDHRRDWGHLLSGTGRTDMEKPEVMLSSVTQETPTEPPQILSLFLPEHFTDAPLVNLPGSRIISQQSIITKCFRHIFKYAKLQL